VIGSETYGGAKNVAVRNLTLNGTDVGLRFKSSRDRGGHIEKIFINGVQMNDIAAQAILFDTYYEEGNPEINAVKDEAIQKKQDVTARTPFFSDFFISNIVCHGADRAILILGLPEAPVSSIVFNNVVVASDKGVLCVNSRDLTMEKMTIVPKQVPVVALRSATDISILNCILPFPVDLFLTVEGESSSGIQILETDLSRVKTPVKYLVGALETSVVTK
jgi:DNA sulfur modification protein DndE